MTPVALSGFDPAAETLDVVVEWDMAQAYRQTDGAWVMSDRVGGTCLDFTVVVDRSLK